MFVLGTLIFLTVLVIGLSCYMVYILDNEEQCLCDSLADISEDKNQDIKDEQAQEIFVEVKGAVEHPGVFAMQETDIINDAIAMAGGFKETAYTDNINLSKKVTDELVIYVFTESEFKKNANVSNEVIADNNYTIDEATKNNISIISSNDNYQNNSESDSALININLATLNELITLPGIGESKANNIINYRNTNGYFKTIEDLKNVNGIGDATFEQLKAYITV